MIETNKKRDTLEMESFKTMPDKRGHFGHYGGRFVSETLMGPLEELEKAYKKYKNDPDFIAEYKHDLKHYVGRPSPLYHAERKIKTNNFEITC